MTTENSTRSFSAFSLVEVVLAIGVVSFSVLATVGLLSVASDTNKNAKDEASTARLASNEFERLRSLSSATFSTYYPNYSTRYYDSNSTDLGTTKTAKAVYELHIQFSTPQNGTADALLNAEVRYPAQAPAANQSVSRFTVLMNIPN